MKSEGRLALSMKRQSRALALIVFSILAPRPMQGGLAWAEGVGAPGCANGVNSYLLEIRVVSEDPFEIGRVKSRGAKGVTVTMAQDVQFLRTEFVKKLGRLSASRRERCQALAMSVVDRIDEYVLARLSYLLKSAGALEDFYFEVNNWVAVAPSLKERERALQKVFEPFEQEYLGKIYERLLAKLKDTAWERYTAIRVEIGAWNTEWLALMGADAPAAVEMDQGRIALRPSRYEPGELEVFLFHELAHLAHAPQGSSDFTRLERNELSAWRETFAFLENQTLQGRPVPGIFKNVIGAARSLGFENWVRLVFMTAHPSRH